MKDSPTSPAKGSRLKKLFFRLSKNALARSVVVLVGAFVVFQLLPHPTTLYEKVKRSSPSWLGLWTVNRPVGQFDPMFPDAETIRTEAKMIAPIIEDLKEQRFFRIFKVDLSKECPFWAREDLCTGTGKLIGPNGLPVTPCGVCECTEDEVPLPWKAKPIEHFVDRKAYEKGDMTPWTEHLQHRSPAETDFLSLLSGTHENTTYVDLTRNPPGFTAYKGRNIWGLIYKENCQMDGELNADGSCTQTNQENIFQKIISGLQTTIMILASEYNKPMTMKFPLPFTAPSKRLRKFDTKVDKAAESGIVLPQRHRYSMNLFRERVAWNEVWMQNLYIDFSLILKALKNTEGILEGSEFVTGDAEEDEKNKEKLKKLLKFIKNSKNGNFVISEQKRKLSAELALRRKNRPAKNDSTAVALFSDHERERAIKLMTNISNIFDCIECEKCRLHGKVKLTALQVAIKANSDTPLKTLERNEIAALVNTLGYFTDSILIIERMDQRIRTLRAFWTTILLSLVFFLPKTSFASKAQGPVDSPQGSPRRAISDVVEEVEAEPPTSARRARSSKKNR